VNPKVQEFIDKTPNIISKVGNVFNKRKKQKEKRKIAKIAKTAKTAKTAKIEESFEVNINDKNQTTKEVKIIKDDEFQNKQRESIRTLQIISDKIEQIHHGYAKGIIDYQETIFKYNSEIEKLKSQIKLEKKKISKEKELLIAIQHEILYENKTFDTLHHDFEEKIKSIKELKFEYKETMEISKYKEILKRKQRELDEILDKIEDKEIFFLNKELERVNLEEKLQPKQDNIITLENYLNEIENKKKHFEHTGLNKPLNLRIKNEITSKKENIEDAEITDIKQREGL